MAKKVSKFEQKWKRENQIAEYSETVQEYLKEKGSEFLSAWVDACDKKSGRISYEDMECILGYNFPKAKWIPLTNKKAQIDTFFNELGIPFRADETHLFFP